MIQEYKGRMLTSIPIKTPSGRWLVSVKIDGKPYFTDDGISYILREEADKESLNLGRNLIARGLA